MGDEVDSNNIHGFLHGRLGTTLSWYHYVFCAYHRLLIVLPSFSASHGFVAYGDFPPLTAQAVLLKPPHSKQP